MIMKANIHSIETCGTVDGPGVRFVIFFQGCPMRCLYCHNPDTWDVKGNQKLTVSDLLNKYDGVKEFCKGGITATGGEPLLQIDFLIELFKEAKLKNIHTALDTSGVTFTPDKTRQEVTLKITDIKGVQVVRPLICRSGKSIIINTDEAKYKLEDINNINEAYDMLVEKIKG